MEYRPMPAPWGLRRLKVDKMKGLKKMEENKETDINKIIFLFIVLTNNLLWLIIGFKIVIIYFELQRNLNTFNNLFSLFAGV